MESALCSTASGGLPWGVVDVSSVTPLTTVDFPSPNSHQLHIASWLGLGLVSASPSQGWDLPRLCACGHSLDELMCLAALLMSGR